jgi:hypothetical protein
VSARAGALETRRAALIARSAAEREALARQLAPLRSLHRGFAVLTALRQGWPGLAMGAGLGLSSLLVALFAGRTRLIRGAATLVQLAGSVRALFSRR